MRFLAIILLYVFLHSCVRHEKKIPDSLQLLKGNDTLKSDSSAVLTYQEFIQQIKTEKCDSNDVKTKLYKYLSQDMPRYWNGTTWDFNGITRVPKQGSIACGYFVTTLLQDIGFSINRSSLSQQPSSVMIRLLTKNVKMFPDLVELEKYLRIAPSYSVFIIGLDFHTGFIIKDTSQAYFFHSNYINRQGVIMEEVEHSLALKSSRSFMIGSLSANETLLKNWLNN